jgi:hypothetical protein
MGGVLERPTAGRHKTLELQAVDGVQGSVKTVEERKGRDSNPWWGLAPLRFSRPAHSTTLPPFQRLRILAADTQMTPQPKRSLKIVPRFVQVTRR